MDELFSSIRWNIIDIDNNIDIQEKKQNKFNKIIEEFAILICYLFMYVRPIIHGVEYKGEKYQMIISFANMNGPPPPSLKTPFQVPTQHVGR